jgi:hypothetical protein
MKLLMPSFSSPIIHSLTIREVCDNIHRKKYLLPAIQREFVWSEEQIIKLFDSLMRDYPIGSFLFWGVENERLNDFQFYEFVATNHERDSRHNPKLVPSDRTRLQLMQRGCTP